MTRAAHFLRSIARSGIAGADAGGLESAVPAKLPDKIVLKDQISAEAAYIARVLKQQPDKDALADLAMNAREGLDRLDADGEDADLSDDHLMGLEAVIRSDGTRPAFFVKGDFIDTAQPSVQASDWQFQLNAVQANVMRLCRATGRVDDPSQLSLGYQGTAFLVGPGLVMTNRHVLRAITKERNADTGTLKDNIVIDFARELGPPRTDRRFPVKSILFRGLGGKGQWLQENGLNFDTLDIAILEIDAAAGTLPEPLPFRFGEAVKYAVRGRKTCVVGFPGATAGLTTDVFDRVFSGIKAFKRLAPGEILEAAGEGKVERDPRNWIMTHDASTLGGNSGSPILDLESGLSPLLGIHFGGMPDRRNWAHAFERLGDALKGVQGLNLVKP
jgi:S1-C subfamily serine protease